MEKEETIIIEELEEEQEKVPATDATEQKAAKAEKEADQQLKEALKKIKETASEEDPHPSSQLSLRTILGGDILTAQLVRSHIWLIVLIVFFSIIYVAFRYQCQQDMIQIDKMEGQLKDAKFKALTAYSTLKSKSRESNVLDIHKQNKESLLHQADQPPYIIQVPE